MTLCDAKCDGWPGSHPLDDQQLDADGRLALSAWPGGPAIPLCADWLAGGPLGAEAEPDGGALTVGAPLVRPLVENFGSAVMERVSWANAGGGLGSFDDLTPAFADGFRAVKDEFKAIERESEG